MMDQNAEEKTLILQASSPAVSDTLLIALTLRGCKINQSMQRSFADRVSTANFCPLCYRRSHQSPFLHDRWRKIIQSVLQILSWICPDTPAI